MNLSGQYKYFLIPVALCQYAIKNRQLKEFHLFIAMKVISSGKVDWNIESKNILAAKMGVSVRTIENIVRKLLLTNWVNKNGNKIYLRNFDFIVKQLELTIGTGVEFYSADLANFRAFSSGAVIGYLARVQKIKNEKEKRRSGLHKKRGNNSTGRSSFFPVANAAIANVFGCSVSTACNYKLNAVKHGYIFQEEALKYFEGLDPKNIITLKKGFPEKAKRFKRQGKKVVEQLPSLIAPRLRYKTRKNLKHNKRGYLRGSK